MGNTRIRIVRVSCFDRPVACKISFFESVAVFKILLGEHYRRLGSLFISVPAAVSPGFCSDYAA